MTSLNNIKPPISVVMPVFNGEKYIDEAIRSILDQTFTDFEFIIIDDCSTDRTAEKVLQHKDTRIQFLRNDKNVGNYPARNRGYEIARGKYICVMDADDISDRDRLRIQFQFMEFNEEVGICGSFIKNIPSGIVPRFITDYELLKVAFLSNNFCSHPSLILRKEFMERDKLKYNAEFRYSADFDLCVQGLKHFKICNIPDVLLKYRRHPEQISWEKAREQEYFADIIRINQLEEIFGFNTEEIPILLHLKLMKRLPVSVRYKYKAEQWIEALLNRNRLIGYYQDTILKQFLFNTLNLCLNQNLVNIRIQKETVN